MINDRTILHCDLNGFYASVEMLSHPELAGLPVAVGGDPSKRKGIILAKNEEAKKFGVTTGEPLWTAKRKCPKLVVLPSHHELYEEYSIKVNEIYSRFTSQVEPFGIDESWLDVSASRKLFGTGKEIADKIRETVKRELGLTISVGVSFNKVFAKLGSDYKKPDATTVFGRADIEKIVHKLPVKDLLYVGKKTADTLHKLGIYTIGDLASSNEAMLLRRFGKFGAELLAYARGEDNSPVACYGETEEAKSIGNSRTFARDLLGDEDIAAGFGMVAEKVSKRLIEANLKGCVLSIVIKDANLSSLVRQKKLNKPISSYKDLIKNSIELFKANWDNSPVRMLGISLSQLTPADTPAQAELFETKPHSTKAEDALGKAILKIKDKYGNSAINFANRSNNDL